MARRRRSSKFDAIRERNARNMRWVRAFVFALLLVGAFAAGFAVRGNAGILERLGIDLTTAGEAANPGMTVSGSTFESLSARIAEVQGVLEQYSLDAYDLDEATNSIIAALADTTADPFLRFYDAEHYQTYLKDVSATYQGIGVLFGERDGNAYIVDVFSGSEAEAREVRVGDVVVAIDGDRGNDGWSAAEATKMVTREAGETVVLTLRHAIAAEEGQESQYTVTLECRGYDEPNVQAELVGTVGYLSLAQITQNADELVSAAVTQLANQGAAALVLDLRDNPGGYLTQAIDVASLFIRSGVVVGIQGKESVSTRQVSSATTVTDLPLVVIVNNNTSGTAEVLAAALKENDRATIVGLTTMGKGSVQSIQELSFGGALRYTSAYYLSPDGHMINGNGVSPDMQVGEGEEGVDVPKNMAVELAQSLAAETAPNEAAAPEAAAAEEQAPEAGASEPGEAAQDAEGR